MAGRTIAIGDIHGCATAFESLLQMVEPQPADTIIPLGDYADRGPDSRKVFDLLIALKSKCNLIPLAGNHEEMMLAARKNRRAELMWLTCGGAATLMSYPHEGQFVGSPDDIPEAHWEFIKSCRDVYETKTHFFVHANAKADAPLERQDWQRLRWIHLTEEPLPHVSGKIMVCGHTPQPHGEVLDLGHVICIDTFACGGGWLTAFEAETRRVFQASEEGNRREFTLETALPRG